MKIDVEQNYWDIGNEDHACYAMLIETGVQQLCINLPLHVSHSIRVGNQGKRNYRSPNSICAMRCVRFLGAIRGVAGTMRRQVPQNQQPQERNHGFGVDLEASRGACVGIFVSVFGGSISMSSTLFVVPFCISVVRFIVLCTPLQQESTVGEIQGLCHSCCCSCRSFSCCSSCIIQCMLFINSLFIEMVFGSHTDYLNTTLTASRTGSSKGLTQFVT